MTIEITQAQLAELAERLDIVEGDDDSLRSDYSGRGMYGRTCLGYVGDDPAGATLELARIVAYQEDPDMDESEYTFDQVMDVLRMAMDELGQPSRDSMGLSTIYYWTRVQVIQEDAEV